MSVLIRQRDKSLELRIKHKLLTKPAYFSFDTQEKARAYATSVESFLARGIVPEGLLPEPNVAFRNIAAAVAAYQRATVVRRNTATVLATVSRDIGDTVLERINYQWAEAWVRVQELEQHRSPLAPSRSAMMRKRAPTRSSATVHKRPP